MFSKLKSGFLTGNRGFLLSSIEKVHLHLQYITQLELPAVKYALFHLKVC